MAVKNYRYKERRDRMIRRIGLWVGEIAAVILLAFVIIQFCFQTVTVHGESMQPTYYEGDTLLVNKLSYRIGDPGRYDPVLLEIENGTAVHYTVKRVIGLPGETVQITGGEILIDGEALDYSFEEEILSAGLAAYEVELGEDEYFVMGDNCNNSEDSRVANIGNIKTTQFVGKIAGRIGSGK
mgnify:FL=1